MTALLTAVGSAQEERSEPASGHAWGGKLARVARTWGRLAAASLVLARRTATSPLRKARLAQEESFAAPAGRGLWTALHPTWAALGTELADYAVAVTQADKDKKKKLLAIAWEAAACSSHLPRRAAPKATAAHGMAAAARASASSTNCASDAPVMIPTRKPLPSASRVAVLLGILSAPTDVDWRKGGLPGPACDQGDGARRK